VARQDLALLRDLFSGLTGLEARSRIKISGAMSRAQSQVPMQDFWSTLLNMCLKHLFVLTGVQIAPLAALALACRSRDGGGPLRQGLPDFSLLWLVYGMETILPSHFPKRPEIKKRARCDSMVSSVALSGLFAECLKVAVSHTAKSRRLFLALKRRKLEGWRKSIDFWQACRPAK
jgi:hypothetical protein